MQRVKQIENIVLIVFTLGTILFGIFYSVPSYIAQPLTKDYNEIGQVFNPFWNYTFLILLTSLLIITIFLTIRLLFEDLFIKSKNKRQAGVLFIFSSIVVSAIFIYLTSVFDSRVFIELIQRGSDSASPVDIAEVFGIQFSPESHKVFNILLTGKSILSIIMYTSFYFLCRTYLFLPSWRNSVKAFVKSRRQDITIILTILSILSIITLIFIVLRSPILPSSFLVVLVAIQLAIFTCILSNIFWLYQKDKAPSLLRKVFVSLGLYAYCAFLITLTFYSAISLGNMAVDLSFSLYYIYLAVILFLYILILSQAFSAIYYLIRRKAIKRHAQLIHQVATKSSELEFLKSQINPHFLFNSLNTVYGLALGEESPKAAEGVQKLSEMMRFMLQENTADKIPLERELKYIHDYIDFQRLRIADKENINLDIEIAEGCKGQIAPMLLIPMIENAFKHGISMKEPSWIKVALTCSQNEVALHVENSMHPKKNLKSEESGIGLENVRKRLEILYPEKHLFQIFESTDRFEANIKVTISCLKPLP